MATDGNKLSRDLIGLFFLFVGLLLLLSLGTFDPADPSLTHVASGRKAVANKAGLFGSYVSGFLVDMLGLAAYFAPLAFLTAGARRIMGFAPLAWWRWFGICILASCVAVAAEDWVLAIRTIGKGGLSGHALVSFFSAYLGSIGMAMFWGFLFLLSVQLVTDFSWLAFLRTNCARLAAAIRAAMEKKPEPEPVILVDEEERRPRIARQLESSLENQSENKPENKPESRAGNQLEKRPEISPESRPERQPESRVVIKERVETPRAAIEETPVVSFSFSEGPAEFADQEVPVTDAYTGAEGRALPGTDLGFLQATDYEGADPPWLRDMEEDNVAELAVRDLNRPHRTIPVSVGQPRADAGPANGDAKLTNEDEVDLPAVLDSAIDIREAVTTVSAAEAGLAPKPRPALPPFSLLHTVAASSEKMPREILEAKGRTLMTCLSDFGIQGELVGIAPGPVVTMFEVRPAAGVRVARIENLSDDLALALKAVAVRVQAPIPGTDTVGIEIPNEIREIVCLKELFCSQAFAESEPLLSMALGKDIQGAPAMADLARMPHLLVAGATGAGKSVCLNSILLSFLYKARPDEVKLLLVDPKRVEMAVYADLPHLVHPVVTEMELAKNALNWAVSEMSRRYNDLALLGVRNIAAYNEKIKDIDKKKQPDLAHLEPMPYLVIVIDELADLMMTAAKEVEAYIMRLAQLARAAGIHMILATQRPSVDVVTGLIKANFPCRIAFQVTSKHDSRTILDAVGAEHLLGKGDMLFKPAGGKFRRLHGAFVSDDDVGAVTDYWRKQQKPSYMIDFSDWGGESAQGGGNGGGSGGDDIAADPMYSEAVSFVREQGKASISLIQRRFRIGFNRAARFVEQMEQDGIIGPADGAKPRVVR